MGAFTDFLNDNVIWAYLILGAFLFLLVLFFILKWFLKGKVKVPEDDEAKERELKDALKSLEKQKKVKVNLKPSKEIKTGKKETTLSSIEYIDRVIDSKGKRVMDSDKFYFEAKPHSYFKKYKWYQPPIYYTRRWKEKRMMKKFPHKTVLIRMEMNNGTHREFLVKDDASGFTYNKARYIFDLESRYWIVDSLIWAYDFHESISIAIKSGLKPNDALLDFIKELESNTRRSIDKKIPINELKETIEQSGISQVENSINPIVLERVIKSEIIQAILQGSALGRLFRVLLIIVLIIVVLVAVDVVLDFISSGLGDEIGLTFGGGGDE